MTRAGCGVLLTVLLFSERLPILADWVTLKQWAGTGAKETETFQTEAGEWRVNWANLSGGLLQIYVYDEGGKLVSLLANTTGVGKDTSYVHKSGRFYLRINAANARWSISAEDLSNPASQKARESATFNVKLTTTKGDVMIQVDRTWAPLGAERFRDLILAGFYEDAAFFRVLPGFLVQFGIPAYPDVAAVWDKATLSDDTVIRSNRRGTLTFASDGPNTRTTQIFINYRDNTPLDGQGFAPFGQVIEGMAVVDKLFSGYGETPNQGMITAQGKVYLDRDFPSLDRIIRATILPDEPAANKK